MTGRANEREAPQPGASTNPAIRAFLAFFAFCAIVVPLAAGVAWTRVLHWIGVALLIIGILLAAKGISDVRREWTQLPGIGGQIRQRTEGTRVRTAALVRKSWNWVVRETLLDKLGLRPRERSVTAIAGVAMAKASASGTAEVIWGPPPVAGTTEERLAWLENHMRDARQQLRTLHALHGQEVAATEEERAVRVSEVQRIRESMADLAGGGLKLQAWGVVCLLAGTLMTAIW